MPADNGDDPRDALDAIIEAFDEGFQRHCANSESGDELFSLSVGSLRRGANFKSLQLLMGAATDDEFVDALHRAGVAKRSGPQMVRVLEPATRQAAPQRAAGSAAGSAAGRCRIRSGWWRRRNSEVSQISSASEAAIEARLSPNALLWMDDGDPIDRCPSLVVELLPLVGGYDLDDAKQHCRRVR